MSFGSKAQAIDQPSKKIFVDEALFFNDNESRERSGSDFFLPKINFDRIIPSKKQ